MDLNESFWEAIEVKRGTISVSMIIKRNPFIWKVLREVMRVHHVLWHPYHTDGNMTGLASESYTAFWASCMHSSKH